MSIMRKLIIVVLSVSLTYNLNRQVLAAPQPMTGDLNAAGDPNNAADPNTGGELADPDGDTVAAPVDPAIPADLGTPVLTNRSTVAPGLNAPTPTNDTTAAPGPTPTNGTTAAPGPTPTNGTTVAPGPTDPTTTINVTVAPVTTTPLPKSTTLVPSTTALVPSTTPVPTANDTTSAAPTASPTPGNTTGNSTLFPVPTGTQPIPTSTQPAPATGSASPMISTTPIPAQKFDPASFIGGIVLCGGLVAIVFFGCKFYRARNDRNYHTL